MDSQATKEIVKNAWAAFATRDAARIEAVFTPDAIWHAPPGNATGVALGYTQFDLTRDVIVRFLSREFATLFVADVQSTPRSLTAEGSRAVLETTFRARLSSGRHYENDYCFVIDVMDGRIHRMREYMDTQRGFRCIFGDAGSLATSG
ncbi:nuclear transport factor 2 family protein [Caenimonas aquaedulcis]|uniref:Nuclear transport factor 2 family protein n=1 Tax=Caenimonas aquaedulcis TaxID=2793270 RepID=A0A931H4Z7_9BURK|nr:nuclear transport factor 2 family protein [Caenimonas aquaedulcis]MBG9388648.1 nuclear transport factor 2 family protein [Caenimonas aquaedulcis]